jgi:hypothetical protein
MGVLRTAGDLLILAGKVRGVEAEKMYICAGAYDGFLGPVAIAQVLRWRRVSMLAMGELRPVGAFRGPYGAYLSTAVAERLRQSVGGRRCGVISPIELATYCICWESGSLQLVETPSACADGVPRLRHVGVANGEAVWVGAGTVSVNPTVHGSRPGASATTPAPSGCHTRIVSIGPAG